MKKFLKYKNILFIMLLIILILCICNLNNPLRVCRYMILYFLIMSGSMSLSYIFKKKIDQTVPLYFFIIFFGLYICGIFNILLFGIYTILILQIIILFFIFIKIIKNREVKQIKEIIVTPASLVYTLLFFVFAFSTRNSTFSVWDEYTFWSIASKNMYYSNKLYLNSTTTLFNIGYPPCPTIIEYFFCKIIGNYSQGIELFAYQMFGFSLFLPFFKNKNFNNIISTICITLSILFIPAIFSDGYFYFTIYADSILGILAGYILYEYFTTTKKDNFLFLSQVLALFTITLTKATGVIIAFIIFLIILFEYFLSTRKNNLNILKDKNIKKITLLFLSIILSFISWRLFLKFTNITFNNGYINLTKNNNSILNMLKVIYYTFVGGVNINSTFKTFFSDFFDKAYYSNMPFGLTASCWISIFSIIYILVYKFIIDKDSKSRYKKIFFLIAIGSILYILLLQVAYYTQFSESEAISHASMQRYVGTIFIMILMFIVGIVFNQSNSNTIYILVPALLLPFTPISLISNATITSGINNYINRNNQIEVIEFSEYVNSKVDSNSKIFPIHQTQNKDSYLLQFRYYMTPNFIPMVDTFNDNEEYSFVKFHSTEEFEKELYKYDYVAVLKTDEYFINKYSSLFEDSTISDWSLYKVTKKEDKILLIKVE